jgi:hypothetical protein
VRVNVVRPGLVQVGRQDLPSEIERDFRSAVVLPRLGCRPTSRTFVSFLASPRATWITGQVISVDGGQTISRRSTRRRGSSPSTAGTACEAWSDQADIQTILYVKMHANLPTEDGDEANLPR